MTKAFHNLLKDHNIFISLVPNNMTHMFQPLDLTVNSWAKMFMKERNVVWYASQIDKFTSEKGKRIVLNGWKAAGILDTMEMGFTKLKCLDPFNDIDPLGGDSISFEDDFQFSEEGNLDVNERYESDSYDEYIWMTNEMLSVPLLLRSSSNLKSFLKHLFCFILFVKAYS